MYRKNKSMSLRKKDERTAYISLIPLILVMLILKYIPMVFAFIKSFTNWDGGSKSEFIGLRNYRYLLESNELFTMIGNNLFLLLHIPVLLLLGFILALYIYDRKPGYRIIRLLFYLPQVVSVVVIGMLFKNLFRDTGIINIILKAVGLKSVNWLSKRWSANTVILIAMVYQSLGWQMLILSGGLSTMDSGVLESAVVDGASYWQKLIHIIIPMQIRSIEYSLVISIIWVFSGLYTFIYTITNGGPGYETTTMDYMVYLKAFGSTGQIGVGCACAVLLLAIVLVLVIVQRKVTDRVSEWQ